MSLLLRTIRAFPHGRLSEQIIVALNKDCDPHKRISFFSELHELESQDLIFRASDGKWKGKFFSVSELQDISDANSSDILNAVPGRFELLPSAEISVDDKNHKDEFNLKNLISYFYWWVRSAGK